MGSFSSRSSLVVVDMSGPVAEFVKKTIAGSKVVIFSKTYCPYCDMAKEVRKIIYITLPIVEIILNCAL